MELISHRSEGWERVQGQGPTDSVSGEDPFPGSQRLSFPGSSHGEREPLL